MELEELKNNWQLLDAQLKKQEVLKERMIQEMLCTKSNKSLSKLINMEVFGIVVLLLIIPLCVYLKNTNSHYSLQFVMDIFFILMIVFCVFFSAWGIYKLSMLLKIDFMKDIGSNIHLINRFNIRIRQEKLSMFIIVPILCGYCTYLYAKLNVNITLWISMTCALLVATFLSIFIYKRIYDKNIQIIQKSLDELKELEEE